MQNKRGFTLIELLVVVVIVGILSVIGTLSYSNYKKHARDSERTSKATVIIDSLEKYYDKNGEYPGCTALTASGPTVINNTLKGVAADILLTPKAANGVTNSISCANLTPESPSDFYSYTGDTSASCVAGTACLEWTFKYKDEFSNEIVTVKSKRTALAANSTTPTITGSAISFTSINTSWTSVANAASYELQRATDSNFTANLSSTTLSPTGMTVPGLNYNTTYYFRVRANNPLPGSWSNTATVTTQSLTKPVVTATTTSSTSVNTSWGSITNATSYNAQCSYDNIAWVSCNFSVTAPAVTRAFSSLDQGHKYYFRVQAVNGSYTSDWSSTVNATTTIDAPAAYITSSSYSVAAGWNSLYATSNAVCPAATTLSYDWWANSNQKGWHFLSGGTAYKTIKYDLTWNETVSLHAASRCITSEISSSFVWSNNNPSRTIPWPTTGVMIGSDNSSAPTWRGIQWWGTCPEFTTSRVYEWQVNAAWGNQYSTSSTEYGIWSKKDTAWGDGGGINRTHCYGPWGDAYADVRAAFGPGCLPTKLYARCYEPAW